MTTKQRDSHLVLSEWLVINAQLGDADSLEQLLKLWNARFFRFACKQLNDDELARDALQNTYESIVKGLPKLQDPAAFPKWAYQLLQRRGIDAVRKICQQKRTLIAMSNTYEDDEYAHTQDSVLDAHKLIGTLPLELYTPVHLFYLEQLNVNEIADILMIPAGTIKSRLHRARTQLREAASPTNNLDTH